MQIQFGAADVHLKRLLGRRRFHQGRADGLVEHRRQGAGDHLTDRVAGGNGLVNLRRRLEEIAGQCDLRSAPGGGTRLSFTIRTKP